jgi:chromosome segregation ATPase
MAKSQREIKEKLDRQKKEGDSASNKALELAKLAEKTKATLESMQGEATAESSKSMEAAISNFQQGLEMRSQQAENRVDKINNELEKDQQQLEKSSEADRDDLKKLNTLKGEALKANVETKNITDAERAKTDEITFIDRESKDVEKSQQELQKNLAEAKQKRQGAKSKYQSRNTLNF